MTTRFVRDGINFELGRPRPFGAPTPDGHTTIYAHATYRAKTGKLHVMIDGAICPDTEAERERNITRIVSAFRRAQDLCDAGRCP